jgi:hypothetical protein
MFNRPPTHGNPDSPSPIVRCRIYCDYDPRLLVPKCSFSEAKLAKIHMLNVNFRSKSLQD